MGYGYEFPLGFVQGRDIGSVWVFLIVLTGILRLLPGEAVVGRLAL